MSSDGRVLALGALALLAAAAGRRGSGLRTAKPKKFRYDPKFSPEKLPAFTVLHGHGQPKPLVGVGGEDLDTAVYPWMPSYTDGADYMYDEKVLEAAWARNIGQWNDKGVIRPELSEAWYLDDNSSVFQEFRERFEKEHGKQYDIFFHGLQEAMALGYSFVKLPDRMTDVAEDKRTIVNKGAYRWYFLDEPVWPKEGSELKTVTQDPVHELRRTREKVAKLWTEIKEIQMLMAAGRASPKEISSLPELEKEHNELEVVVRELRRKVFES